MKHERHILLPIILILCLLTPMASASVIGGPKYDDFFATLEADNFLTQGGGTGWNGGEWIYYDQTNWWNQWFYDDPPTWNRMKHIDYFIDVVPQIFTADYQITVDVALNWSNMEYPFTGMDGQPPMPDEEWAIERAFVFSGDDFVPNQPIRIEGQYDIWDYNPEWVSIDVRVYAWGFETWTDPYTGETFTEQIPLPVDVFGQIIHECIIPEPASIILLGFGAMAMLKKTR